MAEYGGIVDLIHREGISSLTPIMFHGVSSSSHPSMPRLLFEGDVARDGGDSRSAVIPDLGGIMGSVEGGSHETTMLWPQPGHVPKHQWVGFFCCLGFFWEVGFFS